MKKLIFALLVLLLLPHLALANEEIEISADFAGVYNVESGEMLYSKNSNTIVYPASLVKIMTSVLALEYYEKNGDLEVTVTESALATLKGNDIDLEAGEKASFYDLVAAVTVGGANDAALVVAEKISGSVEAFVDMMNDKAKKLGALNTNFDNPTGFHSPYMYTTVEDMAKICAWANENKAFMTLSSLTEYEMRETNTHKKRVFTNSNLLLDPTHWLRHYVEGTKGMNAGSTAEAGYTLATVYNNDGQTNIIILIGGKVNGWDYYYFDDAKKLIGYTSVSYQYKDLVEKDKPIADIKILYGKDTDHVLLTTKGPVSALLPEDASEEDITTDYKITKTDFRAPVKKGEEWGVLTVYYQGKAVETVALVTQNTIKRDYFLFLTGIISNFFKLDITKGVVYFLLSTLFLASVIAYIAVYYRRQRELERRRAEKRAKLKNAKRTI